MGKKKSGDEQPAADKASISSTKVRTAVLRRANTVAAQRGITLFQYLDQILTQRVDADYQDAADRMKQEGK